MPQVVIENPVLNSPFGEPTRHFRFDDEGITNEIAAGRRISSYFVPIAQPKKKGKQLAFETEWTQDRIEENRHVNRIRQRVAIWREGGYPGVTPTTARLLQYWTDPAREKKLFFCQIEALETAIYISEAARRYGDAWIENELREANDQSNPGLPRMALKMATGAGKTVVMAMLIAWQVLNKLATPQDARFSDTFLIVTPGITIRDRLRVLLPNDPNNYYRQRDVLTGELLERLGQAKILITNFHAFLPREKIAAGRLTKSILTKGGASPFTETPDQTVRRVCRELGNKKNIIVLNDEAHHCYRRRPEEQAEKLSGDDRQEAEKRNRDARVWISGIEAVKAKIGIKAIYDLSATPFFLRGSGYPEGTLFPWVVSDFSLIDAIESGIVKVPRVPVADDSMVGEQPTYRDLWLRIREQLPRKGRKTEAVTGEPKLPVELQGALHSLYGNYEKYYRLWEQRQNPESLPAAAGESRADPAVSVSSADTPPVFIVVCNNTNVSKLVFDYIAGWEKKLPDGSTIVQAGALDIFRNDDGAGGWLHRPNTILVDSEQLESGEAMSDDFKKIAAREIDEFKAEYRARFPGRDTEELTDEDLLREVMNTVGKPGKLGEQVKCIVSVSMLTEGWDANTVTHVLGVRAFGTQLLCEQVVGRALRRMSYAPVAQASGLPVPQASSLRSVARASSLSNAGGTPALQGDAGETPALLMFPPEYAEVYGVPFSFIPCSGSNGQPKPGPMPTRVRALEARAACEITFPRLLGYRYDIPGERIAARFTEDSALALSTQDVPSRTELDPIVGEGSIHDLGDLRAHRESTVAFVIARRTLENYFRDDEGNLKSWLFPQLLAITRQWLGECVQLKDNAFVQMLLLHELTHHAADRIYRAIVQAEPGALALKPILRPYDVLGSTRYVDFDTTRPTWVTRADKCHVSHVVADTESWEQKLAQTLEEMPEVLRYVKNDHLGFSIPYTINGEERQYYPDFLAVIQSPSPSKGEGRGEGPARGGGDSRPKGEGQGQREGAARELNLIIEVTGEKKKDKASKVATARTLWAPAVNNHGCFGRWGLVEILDPWNARDDFERAVAQACAEYDGFTAATA